MVPEFLCYKRIPGGITTTNSKEDGFMWGKKFEAELDGKVGGGGRILGTRHKMGDGSVELRSESPSVLDAASKVLREEGFGPQRNRHG